MQLVHPSNIHMTSIGSLAPQGNRSTAVCSTKNVTGIYSGISTFAKGLPPLWNRGFIVTGAFELDSGVFPTSVPGVCHRDFTDIDTFEIEI